MTSPLSSKSKAVGTLYTENDFHRNLPCLLASSFSGLLLNVVQGRPEKCCFVDTICKAQDCMGGTAGDSKGCHSLFGKVPIFVEAGDEKDTRLALWDANAIAFHLSDVQLKGQNKNEQSSVVQWMLVNERDVLPLVEVLAYTKESKDGQQSSNADELVGNAAIKKAKAQIAPLLEDLNKYLKYKTYFVGERITLADLCLFSTLYIFFKLRLAEPAATPNKHLIRWFQTILNHPQVGKAFNALPYTMFSQDAPLCSVVKPEPQLPHDACSTQANNQQQEAMETAEQPKPKNPLAALPKGTFSIDDFKRAYCNQDTDKVAIPHLWSNFDSENYSFWYSEYQYPEELKMMFMTSNLVSGMFQRLDSLRNHAFASVCIFGQDFGNTIAGVWMWRGQELAFPLCPDWTVDYESYKWQKLDVSKPEVREMINGYLKWEPADYQGKKFADGKIFK